MAQSKLHINLRQGSIEVEGEEAFVLKVYEDFKKRLSIVDVGDGLDSDDGDQSGHGKANRPRRASPKRRVATRSPSIAGEGSPGVARRKPMILQDLDLAKLRDFMAPYAPANHMERSALYVHFLKEELGVTPVTANHLFSCFSHMKEKLPVAFGQHLIDTRARKKWIDFSTGDDIILTTVGLNYINFDMKKVGAK